MKKLVIISGPSGVGKTVVAQQLLKIDKDIERVVTCTTRGIRPAEKNGVDYHFILKNEFEKRKEKGEFLEYATVHNEHYYGTPKSGIESIWQKGKIPLLVIEVQGVMQIKDRLDKERRLLIFLLPENKEQLKARIIKRRQAMPAEEIRRRLETADGEMARAKEYDYKVINKENKLDETVAEVRKIIEENCE